MRKRVYAGVLVAVLLAASFSGCGASTKKGKVKLDPDNPEKVVVWHYYNGVQQQNFEQLVEEFNNSVGKDEGIIVESHAVGGVDALTDAVIAAADEEVGADELPNIFAAYADTAYEINKKDLLANLNEYMTEEELGEYVDAYIQEGYLINDQELKMFPVAKSTETFMLNETDWAEFAAETKADKAKLATWEGICETAKQYYEWTDAKTPEVDHDGKAFFGRDAFANYVLVGCEQLGKEMFKVENGEVQLQIDKDIMKRLWDCYYVPYVNGWFGAYGKFRSDDIKTGQLISLVCSSSGALYFPQEVSDDNGNTHAIESGVYELPNFEGTDPWAVQQGAGMVVTKSTPEEEYASTEFLKWFTDIDNNIAFSVHSGYLPVKKGANEEETLNKKMEEQGVDEQLAEIIQVGAKTIVDYSLYSTKAFENANDARKVAEYNMTDAMEAAVQRRDEMVAAGTYWDDAIAELTGDAAFEEWFAGFKTEMENTLKK